MVHTLLVCLSIISFSVYGNEVKEKSAVSTQSVKRPVSLKFTDIHNHKRENSPEHRQLESAMKRYSMIQYAPLNYEAKSEDHREQNKMKPQAKTEQASVNTGRHVYTGQEKSKHDHLEPKQLKQDDNVSQQSYRSFISGHNVETFSETTGYYLEQGVDPFTTRQDHYQKQKVKPPKFVYYQKTKDSSEINTPKQNNVVEQPPPNRDFKFLDFLPADFNSYPRKEHKKSLPYAYSFHNQLSKEKPQQTYAHPRIHLNIARSYNIANQPPEAHLPPILSKAPKALTNLLLNPPNTIMLPVRKVNTVLRL